MPSVPFPAPGDFNGYYEPQPEPVLLGGQSTYSGFLVVTMVDRKLVEGMLPGFLSLATPKVASDLYPVIHLVGHQRDLVDVVQGVATGVRPLPDYQEMILLIPLVEYNGTWHNYAARMYLDNQLAVAGGNAGYAYAKEQGTLTETIAGPRTTTAVAVGGTPYFASDVTRSGPWMDTPTAMATLPRWSDLHDYMSMPILGTDNFPLGQLRVLCSYFEWDLTQSQFAAATSVHQFEADFRPPDMASWVALGSLYSATDGAIAVRDVRWRIVSLPAPNCT